MRHLLLLAFLFATPAMAETSTCPYETQEDRLTEAITPSDHVWIYAGDELLQLYAALNAMGVMQTNPINVDKVYVIEYKNIYHIFFLSDGCIVDVRDILKSQLKVKSQ